MSALEQAYLHCDALLRQFDHDRWLACLFLPLPARAHIHALYAFSLEIARIRESIREPLNGEIRLQYWRDVLEGAGRGEVQAHPVAHALLDTIDKFHLPVMALRNLIDARTFDLYDDPMPNRNDLEGYCGETCSVLFQLGSLILGGEAPALADAAGHAGVAYALAGLMLALPVHLQRGQCYLPVTMMQQRGLSHEALMNRPDEDRLRLVLADLCALAQSHLDKSLAAQKSLPAIQRGAFLPLSLVPLHLKAVLKNKHPALQVSSVAQWRKQWALWRGERLIA